MEKSEDITKLATALVAFQGETPVIIFDKKVKVKTRTGQTYGFEYASFKALKETCKPILLKHALGVTQLMGEGKLTTILIHSSGQYLSETTTLPLDAKQTKDGPIPLNPQEIGGVITYMKRYCYSAILGLVSDDDDDANMATGNTVEKSTDKPKTDKSETEKKITLKPNDENWAKCVAYISQGGGAKPEDLRVKYQFTKETEKQLLIDAKK